MKRATSGSAIIAAKASKSAGSMPRRISRGVSSLGASTIAGSSNVVEVGFVAREHARFAEPSDGLFKPAGEALASAVTRRPAEHAARLGIVRQQTLDLARRGAYPRLLFDDGDIRLHDVGDQAHGVADR